MNIGVRVLGDLVLNINYEESKQLKKIVLETYSGKIKILKNKTFSGPLIKSDIENESFDNLKNEDLARLKNILLDSANRKVSKFKYVIEEGSFIKVFELSYGKNNLYFTTKDRKMNLIGDLLYAERINYKIGSNNKMIFFYEENKNEKKVTDKVTIFITSNKSFIYESNRLIILNKLVKISFIEDVFKGKFIINNNNREIERNLYIQEVPYEEDEKNGMKLHCNIVPKPILYISTNEKTLDGELYFQYDDIEISCNSVDEYIYSIDKKCYRDKIKESYFINVLLDSMWNKSKINIFKYKDFDRLEATIDKLIVKGFTIYTENKKRILSNKNMNFNINYNVNWFELDGSVKIDNKVYSLAQLIDLKDKTGDFIEVNNSAILLPKFIADQKKYYDKKEKKIILQNNQIGQILELSSRLDINERKKINELLSYDKVGLILPTHLKNILRKYQVEGVRWFKYLYKNKIGGCLADDMGLGKTLQVISFLSDEEFRSNEKITLVIVPKTLLSNWKKEILKFNPQLKVEIYHGTNREKFLKEMTNSKGIYLTTYNTVLNDLKYLLDIKFDCLILDEVQYIKNSKSKTYIAINKLNTKNRFALSGTPFENNISEVWSLMNLLNNSIWGNKANFIKEYGNIADDKTKIERLKRRINPYVLRRTKKDVLKNLPEKLEQNIYCDMSDEQRLLYDTLMFKIKEEIKSQPERFEIKSNSMILEGLMILRQVCNHPKLISRKYNINHCNESGKFELFKMKIEEIVTNKNKVVVFSQFTSMLKIMESWIKLQGYKYYYLDGLTKNRQDIVDEFEKSDEGIFLISLKAGGTGLNLVSCQYEIIYDPWWNPSVENQAADRIYRIGQTKDVIIYKFITTNSIEEKIQELKFKKSELGESIFSDMNNVKSLSIKEIKNILE